MVKDPLTCALTTRRIPRKATLFAPTTTKLSLQDFSTVPNAPSPATFVNERSNARTTVATASGLRLKNNLSGEKKTILGFRLFVGFHIVRIGLHVVGQPAQGTPMYVVFKPRAEQSSLTPQLL